MSNVRIEGRKVIVSKEAVAHFNARWPCSRLRSTRAYWFEFDEDGALVDCDVPNSDDGSAAVAMCDDCAALLEFGTESEWMK